MRHNRRIWCLITKGGIYIEKKKKYAYWIEPSLIYEMESMLDEANATSKGEFVRQAIKFYIAFLHQRKSIDFISPLLAQTIKSEVESVEKNMCEMMFKVAVELGMVSNITAFYNGCEKEIISEIRKICSKEVAENNGIINFEKAYDFQHGEYCGEDYSDESVY